jgi:TolB-like protein
MIGDLEQDYFADGIVENVTTALSRLKTSISRCARGGARATVWRDVPRQPVAVA